MKPSEFKMSISVESCDEKTAENDQNSYVAVIPNIGRIIWSLVENFGHW